MKVRTTKEIIFDELGCYNTNIKDKWVSVDDLKKEIEERTDYLKSDVCIYPCKHSRAEELFLLRNKLCNSSEQLSNQKKAKIVRSLELHPYLKNKKIEISKTTKNHTKKPTKKTKKTNLKISKQKLK